MGRNAFIPSTGYKLSLDFWCHQSYPSILCYVFIALLSDEAIGMNILKFLFAPFMSDYLKDITIPTEEELAVQELCIAREICSRLARGNISLANGIFFTDEDILLMRQRVFSHNFI